MTRGRCNIARPMNLALRQMLEGMTLTFDAVAAGNMEATIQFNVTGEEPGIYHLRIANGDCIFHMGAAKEPSLTITTPSDIWLKIISKELDRKDALMQGLYQVNGDLSLLMRMSTLFKTPDSTSDGISAYAAPREQRPAGPIALSGIAWMPVALIPWIFFWSTFEIHAVSSWVSVGFPFFFTLFMIIYRRFFDKPTLMEWGGLGFFTLAGILTIIGNSTFATWGTVISQIILGGLWLGSLVFADMPLCAEYSKWGYIKQLTRTSLFIHPNAVISLMWGWLFLVESAIGIGAILLPHLDIPLTVIRYILLVPAFIFTSAYQKGAANRRIVDVDRALAKIRISARIGLGVALGIVLTILIAL